MKFYKLAQLHTCNYKLENTSLTENTLKWMTSSFIFQIIQLQETHFKNGKKNTTKMMRDIFLVYFLLYGSYVLN